MGKHSSHGGDQGSDPEARPRVSHEATIALSEQQLREMEVPAAASTPPAIPARAARPKPAPVPHDASVWAGKIMLADEIAPPTARSKGRGRRWTLVGVLVAAIAVGVYLARPWWNPEPVVSAAKVAEPVATASPAAAEPSVPAPVAAAEPSVPAPVAAAEPSVPAPVAAAEPSVPAPVAEAEPSTPAAVTETTSTQQTATRTTSKKVKKTKKRTASRSKKTTKKTIKKTTRRHTKRTTKTTRRRRVTRAD